MTRVVDLQLYRKKFVPRRFSYKYIRILGAKSIDFVDEARKILIYLHNL